MLSRFLPRLPVLAVLVMALAGGNQARASVGTEARVSADGRSFTISAPGLIAFRAGFSATVEINGMNRTLDSAAGEVVETKTEAAVSTAYGSTSLTTSVVRFEEERLDVLFRMGTLAGTPQVVLVQAGIRNFGGQAVRLRELVPVMMDHAAVEGRAAGDARFFQAAGKPGDWLLTGLNSKTSSLFVLGEMRTAAWIHEQGGFYRGDGAGFLFGPVGDPVSYLSTLVSPLGNGRVGVMLVSAMDEVRVDPAETRWGQQAGLFFEPPRTSIARWAEWVARTHGSRTAKGALTGWSSVYSPERIARGKDMLGVVEQIGMSGGRLRPDVIQIGENFEVEPGNPTNIADFYPEGFPFYARRISAAGPRAGLKLDFDMSTKGIPQCVAEVRQAVRDGFSYLKLGYHQNAAFRKTLAGGRKTSFEVARENLRALREAAGEDTYILFCEWFTDRATLGLVDASRTGPVTTRSGVHDVMRHVLNSYQLNGRWFAVDNDCYYMATDLKDASPVVGGWPLARTWISMVGMSCGAAFTSDTWNQEKFKPYWRNVEVLTPPAKERTEVLDICTAKVWPRLVGQVKRDWGDFTVALLWNPLDKEQAVTLDFAKAGLDPRKRCAVWSFWENRYLGLAQEFWSTPQLASSASQHLRFTSIPDASVPVVIGSNLHIYCGAAEIQSIRASRSSMHIDLTDAGARAGDLFVYSRFLPILRSTSGLVVTDIDQAGENVWRIRMRDRKHGMSQRIELAILLPVTRQWWFWTLIGLVAAGFLTAIWRYVVSLRLQRRLALVQERSRISRDLHDGMGANLTQIALIAEMAAREPGLAPAARAQLDRIVASTHDLAGELDSVVWATHPGNDSLEHLVQYLGNHAQVFLESADVRLRLDVPAQLPDLTVGSAARHNLFLAAKEALNNIVRHAAASCVNLRVRVLEQSLELEIEDDGRGLGTRSSPEPGADGLTNMAHRMAQIQGRCETRSGKTGRGTLVRFTVPLSALDSPTRS